MFQYHHNLLPKAFGNFFLSISSKHNYNTRLASKSTYYINRVRTNYGKFNLHFSGPSIWNNLDEELKSLSLHSVKEARNSFLGLGVYLLKSNFRIEGKLRFP